MTAPPGEGTTQVGADGDADGGHHRLRGLAGAALLAALLFGLGAGAGAAWNAVTAPSAGRTAIAGAGQAPTSPTATSRGTTAPGALQVHLVVDPPPVFGLKADGQVHDGYMGGDLSVVA